MAKNHISIKELEPFNGSYSDAFLAIYNLLAYEVNRLKRCFPKCILNDLKSYQCTILHKCVLSFYSLYVVILNCRDYYSSGTLIRMIADNLSSYNLIYHENDDTKKQLRHYLFVLDGLIVRQNFLEDHTLPYDGSIPCDEYDALVDQINFAKENTKDAIIFCKEAIYNLDLYKTSKDSIDMLIRKHNWRFMDISIPNGHYKWEDLYSQLCNKPAFTDMEKLLSQFVHGLSLSNLDTEDTDSDFEPILSLGIFLMRETRKFIENDFGLSRKELTEGIEGSEFFRTFCSGLSKLQNM